MVITHPFWKRVIAFLLISSVAFGYVFINKTYGFENGVYFILVIILVPIINLLVRINYWSKPFVSSPFNIFTTKYRRSLIVDLPPEIAYGKFVEVIEKSNLVLGKTNDATLEIFAYKKTNWIVKGANMYIHFEESSNSSRMVILSVSFGGFNEEDSHKTITDLIDEFENSLTI